MRTTLKMEVDSSKEDMGVADMIESYRYIFEMTGGREQIALLMMNLLGSSERAVTRQMVEKWFNQKKRTIPSGVLLVTLLTACELINNEIATIKKTTKAAAL